MAIVHVRKRENPFVQINKTVFEDDRLSWKAKGLLGYLLSKPPGWKVQVNDLIKRSPDGEYAVRTGLQELIDLGYAEFNRIRDEHGVFVDAEYCIYEEPVSREDPHRGFPDVDNPHVENRDISNNDYSNNELNIAPENSPAQDEPEVEDIEAYFEARVPVLKGRPPRTVQTYKADLAQALQEGAQQFAARQGADLSWLNESLRPLGYEFIACAGEQFAPIRSEYSKWRKVLLEWQAIGIGVDQIRQAVEYMREKGLTIGGPESVTKIARDKINDPGSISAPSIPKFHADQAGW